MLHTINAAQLAVEGELDATDGRVFLSEEVANGAQCQRAVGVLAGIIFFKDKAAAILAFYVEHGQRSHVAQRVIVDTFGPDGPVSALFGASFFKIGFKVVCRAFGEDVVQPRGYSVNVLSP